MQPLPSRKKLQHSPPNGIFFGSRFFITQSCSPKGINQLCHIPVAKCIFNSILHYHQHYYWQIQLWLLMPDHWHAILSFSPEMKIQRVMSNWKRYTAHQCGIRWQRDFFDHRIRNDENLVKFGSYIRKNPERKNLNLEGNYWPYMWEQKDFAVHP